MKQIPSFRDLSDDDLVVEITQLFSSEREMTAHVVASLAEFDRRRLHLARGFSSLFGYCIQMWHLTDHEAYNRIEAARAVRRFPPLLQKLAEGELSLTAIRLLAPHLTPENFAEVTRRARHKNKDDIKLLIAGLHPQPPVPSVIRRLPELRAAAPEPGEPTVSATEEPPMHLAALVTPPAPPPSRRPIVAPLSEAHYKLQVTIGTAARERLRQIQDLMRHRIPNGDPAAIVEHALDVLHAELLKKKAAEVAKPRTGKGTVEAKGRHIPASVKRQVWRRDEGQCAFRTDDGRRCSETGALEFHHVQPFALGGEAEVENIEMRCRAHNGFEWERHLDAETAALMR